jgi:hypothetical protein
MEISMTEAIGQRAQLENITNVIAAHVPYQLPLYRAARDGVIGLIVPERDGIIPKRYLENTHRPIVVQIGDDDYKSTGPDGWACARRLRYWARGAIVHAAAGEEQHYSEAVRGALLTQRFLMIETNTAHEPAWSQLLSPHMPVLRILSREGLPHPKRLAASEMN